MRCHTRTYMYTAYQMSSCSVSSLNCCERAFFSFTRPLHFVAGLCSLLSLRLPFLHLPPGSCWTSCCGCLQTPSTHRHYPHACKSLSLIIGPYCTRTNLPTQHGVIASVQYCLIISADSGEAGHYETSDTPPRLEGSGLLTELTGD